MNSAPRLIDLTLPAFSDRLAARTPTPGGGSVAAHLAEVGCALAAMACRFTSGEKFAAVEPAMAARVEELERLRADLVPLVDLDTQAYDAVTAAYKLPKATEAEKLARSTTVQAGLRVALEVPARTLGLALAGARLAAAAAPDVNPNLASDAATATWCLQSAAEAAFYNVRINAASLTDKAFGAARLAECEGSLREVRHLAETARKALDSKLS